MPLLCPMAPTLLPVQWLQLSAFKMQQPRRPEKVSLMAHERETPAVVAGYPITNIACSSSLLRFPNDIRLARSPHHPHSINNGEAAIGLCMYQSGTQPLRLQTPKKPPFLPHTQKAPLQPLLPDRHSACKSTGCGQKPTTHQTRYGHVKGTGRVLVSLVKPSWPWLSPLPPWLTMGAAASGPMEETTPGPLRQSPTLSAALPSHLFRSTSVPERSAKRPLMVLHCQLTSRLLLLFKNVCPRTMLLFHTAGGASRCRQRDGTQCYKFKITQSNGTKNLGSLLTPPSVSYVPLTLLTLRLCLRVHDLTFIQRENCRGRATISD
ncbi:hypothetical protein IWX49DRAFT_389037 [Phyllosticta citricarpa]